MDFVMSNDPTTSKLRGFFRDFRSGPAAKGPVRSGRSGPAKNRTGPDRTAGPGVHYRNTRVRPDDGKLSIFGTFITLY